jgi:hypothetical protein
MRPIFSVCLAANLALFAGTNGAAQNSAFQANPQVYRYADVADLALAASVTVHVKVRQAQKLKGALAAGVALGKIRYLVSADVISLIKGPEGIAPRLSYIIDLPADSQGKTPKLVKTELILFAVPGRPGEIRLVAPDAQLGWSPPAAQMVRTVLAEANRPDAPPRVTGVGEGFYSAGSLPGEGETQIFLSVEGSRPVSLSISRQNGAAPRWFVSLGEVVDESAPPPVRNTLLWYRLACFLPATLPDAAVESLSEGDKTAVRTDYKLVMDGLGQCPRNRAKR